MKRLIAPFLICPSCLPKELPLELSAGRETDGLPHVPLAAPLCGLDLILPLLLFGVLSAIYWMQKRRFRLVEEALLMLWAQG